MNTITYFPSKDELLLKLCPIKGKPTKELGRFKLWWDQEGNVCALSIRKFTEESKEFVNNLNKMKLGGIWKGIRITEEDIKETRLDLLQKLEEKW